MRVWEGISPNLDGTWHVIKNTRPNMSKLNVSFHNCDPTPRNESLGQILVNWVIYMRKQSQYHALICHLPDQNRLKFDKVVMVRTWWHPSIVIKVLWRELPSEQRKSSCFKEEGMPISINIIACLERCCHIWVLQLIYFDKIHHVY
jgi:hypothetical protein